MLLEFNSNHFLVVCNDGKDVRIMRVFDAAPQGEGCFPLLEIQHPNFVDICEGYIFEDKIFAILEYVGFSVEDLLQYSIYPTEREIAYIISQVSLGPPFLDPLILVLQVLTGIQFIWSRELAHPRVSIQNIIISLKGEVKIGEAPSTQSMLQI